jgi:cytochrome b
MQSRNEKIRVWDPLVRIGHWTLAAAFFTAYFTAEELEDIHVWAGYWVAAYVVVRTLWGFIGTKYARFADFVRGPRAVFGYLSTFFVKPHRCYLGHNPAGGAMIVALLLSLAATAFTGLMVEAAAENEGPLVAWFGGPAATAAPPGAHDGKGAELAKAAKNPKAHAYKEVHEVFANLSLGLVILHILGVLAGVFIHRENLVGAMITGDKPALGGKASTTIDESHR